jgi:hypothetical protein
MVLQGIWLDPRQDFSDPHNQQSAVSQVRAVAEQSKDFENVLGYLLMTEPWPEAVLESGASDTRLFFRKLKETVQSVDPRPVSMDSWPPLLFMDHRDFDFVTFNVFGFWPKSLIHSLGHAGFTRWLGENMAQGKPLLIGETGGYAVSQASQTAAGGYGGLSEYDQSVRDLESLRATVEGQAEGSVLVSWIDTWHYPRDPDTHDNEPWEWDGILGIPTDSAKDMAGIPRRIYTDVGAYNQLIPIEPKANHFYPNLQPLEIRVYGSENIVHMAYSVNHGDWKRLDSSGRGWFQGSFALPKLARRRQTMTFQAMDKDETVLAEKEISFLTGVLPEHVNIQPGSKAGGNSPLQFIVQVTDGKNVPIGNRKVYWGCFYPISFREAQGIQTTGADGKLSFHCSVSPEAKDRYIFVAAGTDSPDRVRSGNLRIFTRSR